MRSSACLLAVLLVAGCASTPDDPLVWSDDLARALPRERGDVVEVARFSRSRPGTAVEPWEPYLVRRGNVPTDYRVVEVDGTAALAADAQEGGSGLYRKIRVDPKRHAVLEWRWRIPKPGESPSPPEVASGNSPMARLSLAFHGDVARLDFDDRAKLRLAMLLTANGLPYASLLYVWMLDVPVETVIRSPFTDRVRMIVVESGMQRAGEWVTVRRNVAEDYRRAYGEEPDDIVAVGLM
ncbi:MAG: DUF3047 domain-containing protein, partial [Burkholderiales bacterium]